MCNGTEKYYEIKPTTMMKIAFKRDEILMVVILFVVSLGYGNYCFIVL